MFSWRPCLDSVMAQKLRICHILLLAGTIVSFLSCYALLPVRNDMLLAPRYAALKDDLLTNGDRDSAFQSTCRNGVTLSYSDQTYNLNSSEALPSAIGSLNNLLECVLENRTRLGNQFELQWSEYTSYQAVSRCLGCSLTSSPLCSASSKNKVEKHPVRVAIENRLTAKVKGKSRDYFEIIKQEPSVLTVILNWSASAHTEPAVDIYYKLRQIYEHCSQIATQENCKHCTPPDKCLGCEQNPTVCDETRNGSTTNCRSNITSFKCTSKLPETYFGANETRDSPIFLHIILQGTVNKEGNVRAGYTHIIPSQCKSVDANVHGTSHKLKEVFVISQFWGGGYFHSNIEDVPRLMPYLSFLIKYPDIKIHTKGLYIHRLLPLIGLSPERLVSGNIQADVIYLPQGGGCGWLHETAGHLLHEKYAQYIKDNFYINGYTENDRSSKASLRKTTERSTFGSVPSSSPASPNSIVLIQRSKRRWLAQHEEIKQLLEGIARDSNMVFEVFSDRPLPSFNATIVTFARAKLVVAPHGAGLSNMIFSRAGTKVVEILCDPKPVLCYRDTLGALGQPYVGMLSLKRSGCGALFADLDYLKFVVLSLLTSS